LSVILYVFSFSDAEKLMQVSFCDLHSAVVYLWS